MAPKDYVKRGQAKKQVQQPSTPFPWIRLSITLILIIGFVAFLWHIKDEKAEVVEQPKPVQIQEDDPLPEAPEEKWEFMKILPDPNTTVEVEVPEQETSNKKYIMQCGSFRKIAQAEAMRATIAFQGLESKVNTTEGKNGVWHRVVLGPYTSKRQGERDRHKLQKASITTCRIWETS